ncbi:hypothetical protein [Bartonella taylorii]|uniref:hypothetical protein n=1 Tax=Bartonella taylorii TaxID=33046 RepID=UPI003CCF9C16
MPRKHLKTTSGLVAEIISLPHIKDFDSFRYFIECEKKLKSQSVDYCDDIRFAFPKDWDKLSPTKKAVYIYGPLHMHLVKAFTLVEESKHYKALIKEAKQVLERSVVKVA